MGASETTPRGNTMSENSTSYKANKNTIRPAFTLYHANGKGTGSAIAFRITAATPQQPGFVQIEIARQQTVGDIERRVFPTFDWKGRIIARLTPLEIGEVIGVFRGVAESVRDGAGFLHKTDGRSSKITLVHMVEPRASYQLKVAQDTIAGEDKEVAIYITPQEAFTLEVGLSASMGKLCFGG